MSIKNNIIKFLVWIFRWLPKFEGDRFLVVSTTGLGDTLWGTPALRALRRAYPKGYIGVLTSRLGKEVLKGNPHVDEFFVVGEPAIFSLLSLFRKIRKRKIGTVFIFHTSQRPILPFCKLIGASQIIGTEGINKGLDFILTKCFENRLVHEIKRRLQIVGVDSDDFSMELVISKADRELAELLLRGVPSYIPLVGLHPGAKDRFKQWPPQHFIEVGKRLKDHLGCQIIVTGSSDEKELVGKVVRGIEGAIAISGQLSIHALGALIERLALMISNDTGPMHIAYAMKTAIIGIFTPTDHRLCGPYFALSGIVIQKEKTCRPCLKKKCGDPFCLLQISKEEVFQTALKVFYK